MAAKFHVLISRSLENPEKSNLSRSLAADVAIAIERGQIEVLAAFSHAAVSHLRTPELFEGCLAKAQLRGVLIGLEIVSSAVEMQQRKIIEDAEQQRTALTAPNLDVLLLLHRKPHTNLEIAQAVFNNSASRASRRMDKLIEAGLVRVHADPKDARRSLYTLTIAAKAILKQSRPGERKISTPSKRITRDRKKIVPETTTPTVSNPRREQLGERFIHRTTSPAGV
jgi:DNA-binding MarR family transcriptional regulator